MRSRVISFHLFLLTLLASFVLLTACGQASSTGTAGTNPDKQATPAPVTLDAYGTPIVFPSSAPQRIISISPNVSEMLGALNLQSRVIAVDNYTTYPRELAALPKISDVHGTLNVERIVALKPDLVLSFSDNSKKYDPQFKSLGLHVVSLPSGNLTQCIDDLLIVGRLTFTQDTATKVVDQLKQRVKQIKAAVAGTTAPKVLMEVDYSTPGKPYVFGGSSFGDEMLEDANAINIFHADSNNAGYPQVTDEAVIKDDPQFVILTEDPAYGGNPDAVYKRANWGGIDAVKAHHVYHINVNIVQHPGPRLVDGLQCVAQIIHPDKFSGALPDYCSGTY
ncbi:ABC transporter substrate-binding protein [Ktedonosporobacter rubrisoli]|uniref:ABC transporter substrate-binding protein n=1 Tax=Ktedonosporobacter rubrisoli TaxID=2509675 RepID=A0A4P6JTE9_KTERU|nr:ABC transporter substrate-binding protein [Ktedonosporobacter rubrisoli]QBD78847.1 ABC transporter substrate-binding protein [Ktedonosporobacter rubrisoli]